MIMAATVDSTADSYNTTWMYHMFSWAYTGVDFELPGNGGLDCVYFLSPKQRVLESIFASLFAVFVMYMAYPCLTLPTPLKRQVREGEAAGKRLLLVLMCLTWGCELGFKFATRQMIWIFNPCHIATAVQIYLLAAAPSRAVTAAFRLHMHMLTGAPIAILFPVINTRLLPFETEVYYIQHLLMLVIPFYLMSLGDPYIPEKLCDFSWAATTFGLLFVYHFIPLQLLAVVTRVNLNNMLCPAVSDPFHGPYYRLFAIGHQCILIPGLGKIYAALARRLNWCPTEEESSVADLIKEEFHAKELGVGDNECTEKAEDVIDTVAAIAAEPNGRNSLRKRCLAGILPPHQNSALSVSAATNTESAAMASLFHLNNRSKAGGSDGEEMTHLNGDSSLHYLPVENGEKDGGVNKCSGNGHLKDY